MDKELASDADILRKIEEFCALNGMGVTTFGRNSIGDPNLVGNMRAGRSLTLKTAGSIAHFMASYPQQDAAA